MTSQPTQTDITAKARQLHFSGIVIDTHTDTTQRFIDGDFDLAPRNEKGSVDIPRMKEGGVSAVFFAVWMPSKVTRPDSRRSARKNKSTPSTRKSTNTPTISSSPPPPTKSAPPASKRKSPSCSPSKAAT